MKKIFRIWSAVGRLPEQNVMQLHEEAKWLWQFSDYLETWKKPEKVWRNE